MWCSIGDREMTGVHARRLSPHGPVCGAGAMAWWLRVCIYLWIARYDARGHARDPPPSVRDALAAPLLLRSRNIGCTNKCHEAADSRALF